MLLKKIQHNPPPKDVAFGYYQKYNNPPITKKKYNIIHPLKMLHLATQTLIPPQKKLYHYRLLKNCGVRTRLVRQHPHL